MNINFQETYQSLTTAELLNIVKQANDYQPEAVLAAIALLKERTITREDDAEAERIMADKKPYGFNEKQILNNLLTKVETLVEPIVKPEPTINIQKWMNILIVVLGFYAIWGLVVKTIRWRRLYELHQLEYIYLLELVGPIYLLITVFGLYKRKKWGWILLMIYFVTETISSAYGMYISVKYPMLRENLAPLLLQTLICAGAVYLLSRNYSKIYFNISDRVLRNTFFSAIILYLLTLVFLKYYYRM